MNYYVSQFASGEITPIDLAAPGRLPPQVAQDLDAGFRNQYPDAVDLSLLSRPVDEVPAFSESVNLARLPYNADFDVFLEISEETGTLSPNKLLGRVETRMRRVLGSLAYKAAGITISATTYDVFAAPTITAKAVGAAFFLSLVCGFVKAGHDQDLIVSRREELAEDFGE